MRVHKWINDKGEEVEYLAVADRVPGFLERYPPERYGVIVEAEPFERDIMEIAAKVAPAFAEELVREFMGFPRYRFTATVVDRETGGEAAKRSAIWKVTHPKDYETGETVAFQRVVAALGFDSDTMLEEERRDWVGQDWLQRSPSTHSPQKATASEPHAETAPDDSKQARAPAQPSTGQRGSSQARPRVDRRSAKAADDQKTVPGAMKQQIRHLATQKGVSIETMPTTRAEARKLLKELYHKPVQRSVSQ